MVPAPVAWAVARLADHDALVLGEFHGLAPQIRFVGEVLVAAAKQGLDVDLGAELLPAGGASLVEPWNTTDVHFRKPAPRTPLLMTAGSAVRA